MALPQVTGRDRAGVGLGREEKKSQDGVYPWSLSLQAGFSQGTLSST